MSHEDAERVRSAQSDADLLRAWVAGVLPEVLRHVGEVAAGRGSAEHIRRLRVGLRRLRTAARAFGPVEPRWRESEPAIAAAFRALGASRDAFVRREHIEPRLRQAGAPAELFRPAPPARKTALERIVRGAAFQAALRRMSTFAAQQDAPTEDATRDLDARLDRQLSKLHKQLRHAARNFEKLAAYDQHRVRKRIKRLRYLAEFLAPRYPHRAVRRYLAALEPAQDALGAHNDAQVALRHYRGLVAAHPQAWFAVGWLKAHLAETAHECREALKALQHAERFWR